MSSGEAIFQRLLELAQGDAAKPAGLQVEPHPVVSLELVELPYLGLSLTEWERKAEDSDSSTQSSERTCTIQAEIWEKGQDPILATRVIRAWLLGLVYQDETLGGLAFSVDFGGFQAAAGLQDEWVAVAIAEFTWTYRWRPE